MKRVATLIAVIASLALPSMALAVGSSTCSAYNPQDCTPVSTNVSASQTLSSSSASTLPFTGLDVVLLAAGGSALLGAGLVVRRFSRGVS